MVDKDGQTFDIGSRMLGTRTRASGVLIRFKNTREGANLEKIDAVLVILWGNLR